MLKGQRTWISAKSFHIIWAGVKKSVDIVLTTHNGKIHCSKQLGNTSFIYHTNVRARGGLQSDQLWSLAICESIHWHCPRCNRQRVGRRVKCQTAPKTGVSFGRGDRPSFPLLTVYVAKSVFSFSVGSNYFHGKHHEISAAMWSCPHHPVALGWFIRASGRKKVRDILKCYLSCLAEMSNDWPVL